ncbi:hypothetical protein [Crossiella cryophila]|uniref:Uncharacterized protein YukE n=1 Tax=Crossiella cryophila TaxID=43355 RepID=A0A7W7C4K8_9PSEU|nr:hypothetical protein [Crossiella cryophila]MBB4674455.1 uncharacterized protein YukE [Crossiella cryophila]
MATGYADKTDLGGVLKAPEDTSGAKIEELIKEQGWQVQAVDWAFTKVTGESIVQKVIMPITGDYTRIQMNGDAWRTGAEAMDVMSANLNAGVDQVRESWEGAAAVAHEVFVKAVWKAGLLAEAQVAKLIAKGFDKVAEGAKKLCQKALDLIKFLVNKLIDAIKKAWIPAYGWIKAAELIWDAYQIYRKIMEIVEAVKRIIETAKQLHDTISQVPSQLGKIKDVRSVGDAIEVGKDLKQSATDIKDGATSIRDDARGIGDSAKEARAAGRETGKDAKALNDHLRKPAGANPR